MEKPAVIMNEAAFKMLLEALTGKTINTPVGDGETSTEIDRFVQGYYEQKKDKPKRKGGAPTTRNYNAEYEALQIIMEGQPPMKLKAIWEQMNELDFWQKDTKQAAQKLQSIMDRFDDVKKVGRGLYQMADLGGEQQ